jgi:hypothetical protein
MELSPGTSSVEWVVDPVYFDPWVRNRIWFDVAGPVELDISDIGAGDSFLFGTLHFENGQWSGSVAELAFNLSFTTNDPLINSLYDFEYSSNLIVQGTPNLATNTPLQNADFVYIYGEDSLGSLRTYELFDSPDGTNVASMQIWGHLGSVHLDSYENVRGGGFLDYGVALEPNPRPVPEPSTLGLALCGLAGLGLIRSRGRERPAG